MAVMVLTMINMGDNIVIGTIDGDIDGANGCQNHRGD